MDGQNKIMAAVADTTVQLERIHIRFEVRSFSEAVDSDDGRSSFLLPRANVIESALRMASTSQYEPNAWFLQCLGTLIRETLC